MRFPQGGDPIKTVSFLIKPASSLCNLRCRYCFYAGIAGSRAVKDMGLMSPETAEALLAGAFRAVEPGGRVSFLFQGGEPTAAGLDFFRGFTRRARELCPPGVGLDFSIQTNGVLLDEEWARFLRAEDYLVGLSLDGTRDIHNAHRVDAAGKGTWDAAARSAALLLRHGVRVNALCVVTGLCARSPEKVYRGLSRLGLRFFQFIACLDPIGEARGGAPWSLTPEAYGRFLCRLFDLWYADWEKGDYHSVRLFEDYVHILLGDGAGTCASCGRCGSYFAVEGDGSVYPCDFFVLDRWRMGKLGEDALEELAESGPAREFLAWGREKPADCRSCRWLPVCGGGCKNDWETAGGVTRNHYCRSFQTLFGYAMPRLLSVARSEAAARGRGGPRPLIRG